MSIVFYEFDLRTYSPKDFLPLLSAEEFRHLEKSLRYDVQHRFAIGRGLLRTILGQRLGICPREVPIQIGTHGKPETSGIFFNLSHAEDRMVLALSSEGPVGIDIEKIDEHVWSEELEDFIFSIQEKQFLANISVLERKNLFFLLWTMKEAHLKEQGSGLVTDLRSVDTQDNIPHRYWIRLPVALPFIAHLATSYEVSNVSRCSIE